MKPLIVIWICWSSKDSLEILFCCYYVRSSYRSLFKFSSEERYIWNDWRDNSRNILFCNISLCSNKVVSLISFSYELLIVSNKNGLYLHLYGGGNFGFTWNLLPFGIVSEPSLSGLAADCPRLYVRMSQQFNHFFTSSFLMRSAYILQAYATPGLKYAIFFPFRFIRAEWCILLYFVVSR